MNEWYVCNAPIDQVLANYLLIIWRGRILGCNSCPYSIFFDQRVRLAQAFRTNKVEDDWILKWTVKFALWIRAENYYILDFLFEHIHWRDIRRTHLYQRTRAFRSREHLYWSDPPEMMKRGHPWKSDSVRMRNKGDNFIKTNSGIPLTRTFILK
jgi:hypothetical protein